MRFGQFQPESNAKEDDTIQPEDQDSQNNVATRAERMTEASSGGCSEQSGKPNLRKKAGWNAHVTDAGANSALKERELNPGRNSCGNGEPGDAPPLLNAEKRRKRKSSKVAKDSRK
jgi:hypothetical protein